MIKIIILIIIVIIFLFIISYPYMATNVYPYIRFSTYHTSMTGKDMWKGYDILQPGDIVLSQDNKKLTNIIQLGSKYKHVGLCISKNKDQEIIHSKPKYGVHYVTFADFCFKADKVCILRPKIENWKMNEIINNAKNKLGKPFDIFLNLNDNKRYACTELIYFADNKKYLNLPKNPRPDDFYNSHIFDVVWERL